MDSTLENELKTIGKNIRNLRKQKKISLSMLSEDTGISAPFLSQIENGKVNVNLSVIGKIANAINFSVASFFVNKDSPRIRLIKRENIIWKQLYGGLMETILVKGFATFDISLIRIPCGESSDTYDHHQGTELCYVSEGESNVLLKDHDTFLLKKGDSISYKAEIPHMWSNTSNDTCELIVINSNERPSI